VPDGSQRRASGASLAEHLVATGWLTLTVQALVGQRLVRTLCPQRWSPHKLLLSDAIRQLVLRHAEAREIERQAVAEGMRTMQAHGLVKALAGETTVAEVLRATRDG